MFKKILLTVFLLLPTLGNTYDTFDSAAGILHMPNVQVDDLSYKVEMVNLGNFIFKVTQATPVAQLSTPSDVYDLITGVIKIPDVSVGTDNFAIEMVHQGDLVFKLTSATPVDTTGDNFLSKVIASGLEFPYEIIYGSDKNLWVTERTGKRVSLINPFNGEKQTLLTIPEVYQSSGQDGLLGMALHPELLKNTGQDFVYLAHTYSTNGADSGRKLKILRYTYDESNQKLNAPIELISGLSASNDHNAGRLIFSDDNKLFYSIGDQGANQFANKCTVNKAQILPSQTEINNKDWRTYQGKILRLNLDGSIPLDNPVLEGVQSHIYSYGHRNPQGLIVANGRLFSAEHGPKTDDEINLISAGGNYGWPHIAGFQDDKAYEYCNWSSATDCGSLDFSDFSCPVSVQPLLESDWIHADFVSPLKTFYTVDNDFDFENPPGNCTSTFICWPSIAPSSIDHYNPEAISIPGWNNSLFMTSLKKGEIYRVKTDSKGNLSKSIVSHWYTQNRYRDIAIDLAGKNFYIATDSGGKTSGPSGGNTDDLVNPGSILVFSYVK